MFEPAWSALNPSVLPSSTGLCIHMSIGYIVLYTVQYITRYTYMCSLALTANYAPALYSHLLLMLSTGTSGLCVANSGSK